MAIGTWDDFTSKYGFQDGGSVENRDELARDALVKMLNARWPAMRAAAYDRPGVHNPILIIVEGEYPDDFYANIQGMIFEAYDEAEEEAVRRRLAEAPKEWRPKRRPPKK